MSGIAALVPMPRTWCSLTSAEGDWCANSALVLMLRLRVRGESCHGPPPPSPAVAGVGTPPPAPGTRLARANAKEVPMRGREPAQNAVEPEEPLRIEACNTGEMPVGTAGTATGVAAAVAEEEAVAADG